MEKPMSATPVLHTVSGSRPLYRVFAQGLARILAADRRHREARDLSNLDNRLLRDIGITRHQADDEVRRLLGYSPDALLLKRDP
jgi:uncharacterized protein YjiS (DUF1127 family)